MNTKRTGARPTGRVMPGVGTTSASKPRTSVRQAKGHGRRRAVIDDGERLLLERINAGDLLADPSGSNDMLGAVAADKEVATRIEGLRALGMLSVVMLPVQDLALQGANPRRAWSMGGPIGFVGVPNEGGPLTTVELCEALDWIANARRECLS